MAALRLAGVALVLLVLPATPWTQQNRPSQPPCADRNGDGWKEPVLRPRDEGETRPDFARFRSMLRDAVKRKDADAVMAIVDPHIRVSFGGDEGREAFREKKVLSLDQDFWTEFDAILAMGGRFTEERSFSAPYVFSDWPSAFDAFECVAVVASSVRIRQAPGASAPVIAVLDFRIVQALSEPNPIAGWRRVALADGRTGFVAARYVRSPIDHRALFDLKDGRWWLVAYIQGD
jgi:hypothetical protein